MTIFCHFSHQLRSAIRLCSSFSILKKKGMTSLFENFRDTTKKAKLANEVRIFLELEK